MEAGLNTIERGVRDDEIKSTAGSSTDHWAVQLVCEATCPLNTSLELLAKLFRSREENIVVIGATLFTTIAVIEAIAILGKLNTVTLITPTEPTAVTVGTTPVNVAEVNVEPSSSKGHDDDRSGFIWKHVQLKVRPKLSRLGSWSGSYDDDASTTNGPDDRKLCTVPPAMAATSDEDLTMTSTLLEVAIGPWEARNVTV